MLNLTELDVRYADARQRREHDLLVRELQRHLPRTTGPGTARRWVGGRLLVLGAVLLGPRVAVPVQAPQP